MSTHARLSYIKDQLLELRSEQEKGGMTTPFDLSIALEFKLATWVAFQLPLPDAQVESQREYYATYARSKTNELVQGLNEEVVLNVGRILKEIYRQWQLRYNLCHRPFHYRTQQAVQRLVEPTSDTTDVDPDYQQVVSTGLYGSFVDFDMDGE